MPSIFDSLRRPRRPSGADLYREAIDTERPEAATDYLTKTVGAQTSAAMPGFLSELQNIREGAIRRGIGGGELGTSYEGDLASAFQRNVATQVAGKSYDAFQTSRDRYLDLLTGQRDYETAQANAKRKRGGLFGKILGTVAGSFLGPFGAAIGGNIGDKLFASAG